MTSPTSRFRVVELESRGRPIGLSCIVQDRAYNFRVVREFKSERVRHRGTLTREDRFAFVRQQARDLADELNAKEPMT